MDSHLKKKANTVISFLAVMWFLYFFYIYDIWNNYFIITVIILSVNGPSKYKNIADTPYSYIIKRKVCLRKCRMVAVNNVGLICNRRSFALGQIENKLTN